MDHTLQIRAAAALGHHGDPSKVPQWMLDYFNEADRVYAAMAMHSVRREHGPLVILLAKMNQKIAELEAKVAALSTPVESAPRRLRREGALVG